MYLLSLVECWWKLMVYIMFIGTVLWGTGVNIGAMGVGDGALSREFTHIIVSSNPLLSRYNKQTYVILSLYCKYSRLPPKKIGRFILILTSSIIFRRILKKQSDRGGMWKIHMTRLFSKHNGPHGHFTRNNYELVLRCGLVFGVYQVSGLYRFKMARRPYNPSNWNIFKNNENCLPKFRNWGSNTFNERSVINSKIVFFPSNQNTKRHG